jgi:hypothetical protein
MEDLGPFSEEEKATVATFLACLRSPALRESVMFQRFKELIEIMSRKMEAGEDVSSEGVKMVALNAGSSGNG